MLKAFTITILALNIAIELCICTVDDLPDCIDVIKDETLVSTLCSEGASCKIAMHDTEYAQVLCDCSKMASKSYYFVGKYCEIRVPIFYKSSNDINDTVNTCLLEDLLGINMWKNDFNIYGKLVN